MQCEVWSVECEDFASSLAEKIKRLSREGHGRDRVSLNYRSFMFGKLPPPACPGLCFLGFPWTKALDQNARLLQSVFAPTSLVSILLLLPLFFFSLCFFLLEGHLAVVSHGLTLHFWDVFG